MKKLLGSYLLQQKLTLYLPCRFVVATTTSKNVLLWTLLGPVTIAGSLGTPVQTIAIKRFTTESNRCALPAMQVHPGRRFLSLRVVTAV